MHNFVQLIISDKEIWVHIHSRFASNKKEWSHYTHSEKQVLEWRLEKCKSKAKWGTKMSIEHSKNKSTVDNETQSQESVISAHREFETGS